MPLPIENPVNCQICDVISFLSTKDVKVAEIHREINKVYGENIISDGMIWK